MISLYQWLQERKNYKEWEASETVDRFECGMEIPDKVRKDIKEYTEEFIQTFK